MKAGPPWPLRPRSGGHAAIQIAGRNGPAGGLQAPEGRVSQKATRVSAAAEEAWRRGDEQAVADEALAGFGDEFSGRCRRPGAIALAGQGDGDLGVEAWGPPGPGRSSPGGRQGLIGSPAVAGQFPAAPVAQDKALDAVVVPAGAKNPAIEP